MPPRQILKATALLVGAAVMVSACGSKATYESLSDKSGSRPTSCLDTSGDTITIGALNSLSGTMAISETTVRDSINLAVDEINRSGGVLGKQLRIAQADGRSNPSAFAEEAEKLLTISCVAAIFGGWTSSSRKAMKPVVENLNGLLFYPVQYEGMESSPNIYYLGATTNQQIVPGLDYLREQGARSIYLVGSDYVFPRTANDIIRRYAAAHGIEVRGEDYVPLGATDFATIVSKVRASGADAVFNTLNGDSNVAFFREYTNVNLTPSQMPVLSVSIAEEEVAGIGAENLDGQIVAWNYYQTLASPKNEDFVAAFKARYGAGRVTSDPMEAAYTSVYLWRAMVERAGTFDVDALNQVSDGVSYAAPEGTVVVDGENHHVTKTARIGRIDADGLIRTTWDSGKPITPDPFLTTYPWS